MALRLRRGTDAQRQLITPTEGELIYVTDTTELYVGDGTTQGGVRITGEVVNTITALNDVDAALPQDGDLLVYDSATGDWVSQELPLADLSDVDASSPANGSVLTWDSATSSWRAESVAGISNTLDGLDDVSLSEDSTFPANGESLIYDLNNFRWVPGTPSRLQGDIVAGDGNTIILDSGTDGTDAIFLGEVTGTFNGTASGTFTGSFNGPTTGNHFGDVTGDVLGSIRGNIFSLGDSSVLLNAENNTLYGDVVGSTIEASNILSNVFEDREGTGNFQFQDTGASDQETVITINSTLGDKGSQIFFITDATGEVVPDSETFARLLFRITDDDGTETPSVILARKESFTIAVGDKSTAKTHKFDTATGNAGIGIEPDSDAKLNVGGATLLGNMDTTTRDALTASNGMIIYNTTDNKFQGYENGSWVNLI